MVDPVIGMSYESKKNAHRHIASMSLAECQNNLINVNFHLQKSLKNFDKNSADKIWTKKDKEIKVSLLMPNRVKRTVHVRQKCIYVNFEDL